MFASVFIAFLPSFFSTISWVLTIRCRISSKWALVASSIFSSLSSSDNHFTDSGEITWESLYNLSADLIACHDSGCIQNSISMRSHVKFFPCFVNASNRISAWSNVSLIGHRFVWMIYAQSTISYFLFSLILSLRSLILSWSQAIHATSFRSESWEVSVLLNFSRTSFDIISNFFFHVPSISVALHTMKSFSESVNLLFIFYSLVNHHRHFLYPTTVSLIASVHVHVPDHLPQFCSRISSELTFELSHAIATWPYTFDGDASKNTTSQHAGTHVGVLYTLFQDISNGLPVFHHATADPENDFNGVHISLQYNLARATHWYHSAGLSRYFFQR